MKRLRGTEIALITREQLGGITGLAPDTISSLHKTDAGWRVTVEMVEMKRIPDSNDMLGCYEVEADDEGNIVEYRRTRRYCRQESMSAE